jgi:hypothetical protein
VKTQVSEACSELRHWRRKSLDALWISLDALWISLDALSVSLDALWISLDALSVSLDALLSQFTMIHAEA